MSDEQNRNAGQTLAASGLLAALVAISKIGGNLPDERLTDKTGPNDAAHRGLMYCAARSIALEAIAQHEAANGASSGAPANNPKI